MSAVSIASVVFGVLLIAFRLPMLVAPQASLGWLRALIAHDAGIRVLGVFIGVLGVAGLGATWGAGGWLAWLLSGLSCLMLAGAGLVGFAPGVYRRLAEGLLSTFDDGAVLRVIGFFGSCVGVFFVWAGLTGAGGPG